MVRGMLSLWGGVSPSEETTAKRVWVGGESALCERESEGVRAVVPCGMIWSTLEREGEVWCLPAQE